MRIFGRSKADKPRNEDPGSRRRGAHKLKHPSRLLPELDDRAFLPAALEIIETPPSPAGVWMITVICAFVVAALAWAWFGRLDIYATARGKFVPSGYTKVIQPLDAGKVSVIAVRPNQVVKAGEIVMLLDASEVRSEIAADTEAMIARRAEALRRKAALSAVVDGVLTPPAISWPDEEPEAIRQREDRVLAGDLGELSAALAHLDKQRLEKEATVKELEGSIAAQTRLIETLRERVALRQQLIDKNVGTRTAMIDAMQGLREGETQLAGYIGKRDEALAAVGSIESERAAKIEAFLADNTRKMAEANRLADEKEADRTKARVKLDHMTLRAPVNGVVHALAVTSLGQVVTTGQELMHIVPANTPLEIQAYVSNEDIGFVSPGQPAVVKVDAFPFARYGTVDATVSEIAQDAIPADTANRELADQTKLGSQADRNLTPTAQPMTNLVFEAKLRPSATTISINDKDLPLSPGMTVSVEIRTGTRRIINYVFSPLVEVAGKAMKER
jgi:hemolysin D